MFARLQLLTLVPASRLVTGELIPIPASRMVTVELIQEWLFPLYS